MNISAEIALYHAFRGGQSQLLPEALSVSSGYCPKVFLQILHFSLFA